MCHLTVDSPITGLINYLYRNDMLEFYIGPIFKLRSKLVRILSMRSVFRSLHNLTGKLKLITAHA